MNLEQLHSLYNLHDSVLTKFTYSLDNRHAFCELMIEEDSHQYICSIKFNNISLFHIESNNSDFMENELIDIEVLSGEAEYFRGFFSEGFGKPGKLIEIRCNTVEITIDIDFEKQIRNIKKGKQLGCIIEIENSMLKCGIQKRDEQDYLVYISNHDFEFDQMDSGIAEYYSFSDLEKAIKYIISKGFPFDKFATRKGVNFFNIKHFRKDNTVIIN